MKILNIGSCNIDFVYALDHFVTPGETQMSTSLQVFPGGKGLNQSIATARAGGEVYHAGCVGTDGGLLVDTLTEAGVDITYLQTVDAKNGHAIIQVNRAGENCIFLHKGSNGMVDTALIDRVLSHFAAGDLLLLQNEINNVPYIVEKAHERGLKILFNPSPFNETVTQLPLHKLSYIIVNEGEAMVLSGASSPDAAMAFLRAQYPVLGIVLTLGARGCMFAQGDFTCFQPAFEATVVDTTGAGDTFTGYLAAGLARGEEISNILKTACAASAIAVSRHGAAPSIPLREEVLRLQKGLKPRTAGSRADRQRQRLENYLDSDLRTASLIGLAEALGYSPVYTGTLVKKLTGHSFTALLQKRRCAAAAQMLSDSDLSVSAIIAAVGYENETFFRKTFKALYGKNPLAYRKAHSER